MYERLGQNLIKYIYLEVYYYTDIFILTFSDNVLHSFLLLYLIQ